MEHAIFAIGKWKRAPEKQLFGHYHSRMREPFMLKELNGFPKLDAKQRRIQETALLFQSAKEWGAGIIYALDETGKSLNSVTLAHKLQELQDSGNRKIAWLIGGDVGFDKSQLKQSHMLLSLGNMTWPHLLVRVLLTEQIYRAYTINVNHPYHRDN